MTAFQKATPVNIEITPALPEQEPVLANLLELYAHDFSEFTELELGADGRFGYKHLSLYWIESTRHPFLVKVNDNLAGLVFLSRGSQINGDPDTWDMAEFFIVRGYRRLGIGMKVAHDIWRRFPGRWEVRVIDRNQKAREFWGRAITEFVGRAIHPGVFEKDGESWNLFSFESQLIRPGK
jgi:predicted acetyltransferase